MLEDLSHILVVDDDKRLRELLRRFLGDNGFRVSTAATAADARARMAGIAFDLIILDVMMPGETGLEFAATLRPANMVPILMLTAMGEADDRIAGLETGVDDYLIKPFEPRELVLRIQAILRRAADTAPPPDVVSLGDIQFDPTREELRQGEDIIRLTSTEAGLLRTLASAPGATFSREDLADMPDTLTGERTIDVQVTRLRRKIEPDPRQPRYLQTVRGKGYRLMPD